MVIGVLQAELRIDWAESLKDKRRVVRSLRDRLHREHLVSFAEVAAHNVLNSAVVAVAVVSEHGTNAGNVLDRVERKIRSVRDAETVAVRREILQGALLTNRESPDHSERYADLTTEMLARAADADTAGSDTDTEGSAA